MESVIEEMIGGLLENKRKVVKEARKAHKKINDQIRQWTRIKELRDKNSLTKDEIQEIMDFTCYKSLSFCCGLEKKCPFRNSVLEALHISKNQFLEVKGEMTRKFVKLAHKKLHV